MLHDTCYSLCIGAFAGLMIILLCHFYFHMNVFVYVCLYALRTNIILILAIWINSCFFTLLLQNFLKQKKMFLLPFPHDFLFLFYLTSICEAGSWFYYNSCFFLIFYFFLVVIFIHLLP